MPLRQSFQTACFVALGLFATAAPAAGTASPQSREICAYNARISARDKVTQTGRKILARPDKAAVLNVIRKDRANYYRFKQRDAEDEPDCLFSTKEGRNRLFALAPKTTLSPELIRRIEHSEPMLHIRILSDRLDIAIAGDHKPPRAAAPPAQAPTTAMPPAGTPSASFPRLMGHEKTLRASQDLQHNQALQQLYAQWIDLPQYAQCTTMLADIERKLGTQQYELNARQWDTYSALAAGMQHVRQQLLARGLGAAELENAVRTTQRSQQGQSNDAVYALCYQAMQPIYEKKPAIK